MAEFYFPPEWLAAAGPPPDVDPDRIEGLQNGFLAATHEALHTAPDAFYGKAGQDAVDGVPAIQERLSQLRDAALEGAKDEGERAALTPRLDAQLTNVQGGIDRHVAEQRQVRNQQIALERHALIEHSAAAEPDETMLPSLAQANASVAQSIARMTGAPEEPAILAARSAVWRSAIGQRLATGQGARAIALFDLMKDRLVPADQRALDVPIQAARTDAAADQWIEREAATQGEPLATRLQADTSLSPAEKATALAKVEAKNSAQESARLTTVKGLDDRLGAASQALATQPTVYRPGTLATIADGYDAAGELDKANAARRVALQESFLLPFARSSVAAQQRLIDSLPEGEDRAATETIQRQQVEAFAKDAFAAGTALYPDVGRPVPGDNIAGRVTQARTIAAYRGIPVAPFTVDEIAVMRRQLVDGTPQQRDVMLTQVNALPADMKAAIGPVRTMSDAVDEPRYDDNQPSKSWAETRDRDVQTAQLPPITIFGRPPPVVLPRPLTPLEELPEGSAGGPGAGKPFPRSARDEIPEGTPCAYCKQPTTKKEPGPDQLNLDHVKPKKEGGDTSPENRAPSCRTCNLQKGGRSPEEWYNWREVY